MAPSVTIDDGPASESVLNLSKATPNVYEGADEKAFQEKTSKYLLHYGTSFNKDVICGAKGLYVYTATGHKVLDWTSGQMSCLLGHGHPEIVKTIADHAANLDHLFSGMVSPPVISLAERLCNLLPAGLDKAFFLSTGGESNEAAIKIAKVFTGKIEIVGIGASWHGMTAQALGTQYHFGRKGQGPQMPGMHMLPQPNAYRSIFRRSDGSYDWETELEYEWRMIDMASCGSLAACIIEPIQSSAGMHVLPTGYLKALKKHYVTPDILTLSKTLGNGLPLSAVITSAEIDRVCMERDYSFYTTHVNDPLPAAVGDKVLEIVVRDHLVTNSRELGKILHDGLKKLQSRYGCIGDVRGRGLMAGVEIVADRSTKVPDLDLAKQIGDNIYANGVWANLSSHLSFGGTFRIAPPITISQEQLAFGLSALEKAFADTPGSQPLY
ncbi:PLP-dependent transferase [Xylariaceae sp. FL0255]|nr:PLP-dependent transferase [Xylariaceae sp. FL0255]